MIAVASLEGKTVYLLLDTGATSSLITKSKADELNLIIHIRLCRSMAKPT